MTFRSISRFLLISFSLFALSGPAIAAEGNPAKKTAKAAAMSLEDRKASLAEEQDRLAREKKDLLDRQQALQGQVDTGKKLATEKDKLIKQLEAELAALKGEAAPAKPAK